MNSFHQLVVNWCRSLSVLALLCMISACGPGDGTRYPGPGQHAEDAIAILGIASSGEFKPKVNHAGLASELAARLAERGDLRLVPATQVRRVIGNSDYSKLTKSFRENGRFSAEEMRTLMAADLRTSRAIILRLESDETEKLPVYRQAVYNQAGVRVVDRERRIYAKRRTTALTARIFDLRSGQLVWYRKYRISPENRSVSRQYLGSSFSGTVAAEVANTVINGFGGDNYPSAPSLNGSLRALIQEVALKIPSS
ncbi:MAG: hypothetical protein KTR32_30375 [Granulosicoccus sp.]|nr:hypothetical protein [Granulosicoccus sp.]